MDRDNHLRRGIPVLASLDINETVEFYRTKLGFDKTGYMDANYAVIGRDDFIVHFWKCNDFIHPQNTSCYVDVHKIEELYREFLGFNVIHPNGHLEDKVYGMREYAILDIHGNLLKFGEEIK